MKFSDDVQKYLRGESFNNSLKVNIADKESAWVTGIPFLKQLALNQRVVHIGAADHLESIDRKIQNGNWLHHHLMEASSKCIGVDINKDAVDHLKERYGIQNLYCSDVLTDEPSYLGDDQWDFVLLADVLEHIPNVSFFLKTLRKKLAGTCDSLVITVPNAFCLRNLTAAFFSKAEKINSDHRHWFSPYTLAKLLTEAGFDSIEFNYLMRNDLRNPRSVETFFKKRLLTKNPSLMDTIVFKCNFGDQKNPFSNPYSSVKTVPRIKETASTPRRKPTRILFVAKSSGASPSTRVRVTNIIPELKQYGFTAELVLYPKKLKEKIKLFKQCAQHDIVFLQKKLPSLLETYWIRKKSKMLVFDFDDAIYLKHENRGLSSRCSKRKRKRRFEGVIKRADLVIAGNDILANAARPYNANVQTIPSSVETRDIPVKDYKLKNQSFVIGWIGGEINLPYLKMLVPVFQRLATKYDIEVRIISSDPIEIPGVNTRFTPWDEETQEKEISCFDAGIMPLPDTPHAQGKCAYKALQYMAAGVPPVVSDVGINRQIVDHGVCGLVAKEMDDFFNCLEMLIQNPSMAELLGKNARIKCKKHFSTHHVAKEIAALLPHPC